MSVSRVSSPTDPYAAPPVNPTGHETARESLREEPGARQGHHDKSAPQAETPGEGTDPAPGSDSIGTLVDVRV